MVSLKQKLRKTDPTCAFYNCIYSYGNEQVVSVVECSHFMAPSYWYDYWHRVL